MIVVRQLDESTRRVLENYVSQVRFFLRDFPQLNRLVLGEESSDRYVAWALQDAVTDWNGTPPPIGSVSLTSHPRPDLLVRKAAATLLQSTAFLQTRNHLQYSDGQMQISSSARGPEYRQIVREILSDYEQAKREFKIALNLNGGWGSGVNSDLRLLNFYTLDIVGT